MAKIVCPGCSSSVTVADRDMRPGAVFRCGECGLKILMMRKSPGDEVLFPTMAPMETLLDMGEIDLHPHPPKPPKKE